MLISQGSIVSFHFCSRLISAVVLFSARWISESPEGHAREGYGTPILAHPAPGSDMETGSRRGVERYLMELS